MATVLAMVSALAILGSALMCLFLNNLNLFQASNNGELAQREAEAGLTEVLARLNADPDLGIAGAPVFRSTVTPGRESSSSYHQVSFDPKYGPYSTNNKLTDASPLGVHPTGYHARALPPGTVHLISQGYCQGQYRTLEALVVHPNFPYALACDGDIASSDALVVAGADNALGVPPYNRPGSLASNASLNLAGAVNITGSARAGGSILVASGHVDGGVYPQSPRLGLPFIPTTQYDLPVDSSITPNVWAPTGGASTVEFFGTAAQVLSGYTRCDYDVIFHAPVDLRNGLLRCSKSVRFLQGLTGEGAVVADGEISLRGERTDALQWDRVALVAGGPLHISLAGTFRGLAYSQRSLQIENSLVIGSALSSGPPGSQPASVTLTNVTAINYPQMFDQPIRTTASGTLGNPPFLPGFAYDTPSILEGTAQQVRQVVTDGLARAANTLRTGKGNPDIDLRFHMGATINPLVRCPHYVELIGLAETVTQINLKKPLDQTRRDALMQQFDSTVPAAIDEFIAAYTGGTEGKISVHWTQVPGQWDFRLNTFVTAGDRFRVSFCKVWNGPI